LLFTIYYFIIVLSWIRLTNKCELSIYMLKTYFARKVIFLSFCLSDKAEESSAEEQLSKE
ncbi:MAG: hypothetical protein KAI79_16315, partial [Bacteroidales bacterium]|nr:hypothetical protein [Bacteroidales bacterium]